MEVDEKHGDGEETESIKDFDQQDPKVILENKRKHPAFSQVIRSKGFFWLATRAFQFGEWSQAGGMLTIGCGGPWFVEVPDEAWPEDKDVRESIQRDFSGPWGDRRQEIVFIGMGIDPQSITELLDSCLVDDSDMQKWEKVMKNRKLSVEDKTERLSKIWEDGWEEWPAFGMEDEEEENEHMHIHNLGQPKRKISEYLPKEAA